MEVSAGIEPASKPFAEAALTDRDADLMDLSLGKPKLGDLRYAAFASNEVMVRL